MGHDQDEALECLARSAATHALEVQAMQQQEHEQLQREVAELRRQHLEQQQEQQLLRQELAELRAMLTASRK